MVLNAGLLLENGQNKRRKKLETVAFYPFYNLIFR